MKIVNTPTVNFLEKYRTKILINSKRVYIFQLISFIIFGGYIFVLVSVFAFFVYLNLKNEQIDADLIRSKNKIAEYSELELRYNTLKQKSTSTIAILDSLQKHQSLIEAIFNIIPEGIEVKGFTINENNDVAFSASTDDVSKLEKFINMMENNITGGLAIIDRASIGQISIDKDGIYSFQTTIKLLVNSDKDNS